MSSVHLACGCGATVRLAWDGNNSWASAGVERELARWHLAHDGHRPGARQRPRVAGA